jgi:hypothetical protein
MATKSKRFYCITYDAAEALPFGFIWMGANTGIEGGSDFHYFATRAEGVAHMEAHTRYEPVLLDDESADA